MLDGSYVSILYSNIGDHFWILGHSKHPGNEYEQHHEQAASVVRLLNSKMYSGISPRLFCKEILG